MNTHRLALTSVKAFLLCALLTLGAAVPAAWAQPGIDMDGLERVATDRAIPSSAVDLLSFGNATTLSAFMRAGKWESKRDDPDSWSLARDEVVRLEMPSKDDSVNIGHKVGPLVTAEKPILKLKFRIDKLPRGADLSKKKKEDSAFRFFLLFDKKDGWAVPNTIGYAWGTSHAEGSFIRNDRSMLKNVWYVVVGQGASRVGEWIEIERDVEADYRKAFKISGRVPNIVAVALKVDTNNVGGEAGSAIAEATLNPR